LKPAQIEFTPALGRLIRDLPPSTKHRVGDALREIADSPLAGKPLRDDLAGLRSYRLGGFRIVYQVKGRLIQVVTVGPRRNVYSAAALALKRGDS